mgnify:CR=1 FL=1
MSNTDREQLRAERKLRLIEESEMGSPIELVPKGVYGFTYSPNTEGVPLFAKHTFQVFEVRKLADESVHYIGYMTPEEAKALASNVEQALDLKLYPEPFETAAEFVSVPRERILRAKPVSREKGNWFPLTVVPTPQ